MNTRQRGLRNDVMLQNELIRINSCHKRFEKTLDGVETLPTAYSHGLKPLCNKICSKSLIMHLIIIMQTAEAAFPKTLNFSITFPTHFEIVDLFLHILLQSGFTP